MMLLGKLRQLPNIWATLVAKFIAKTFKNRPIWSHCPAVNKLEPWHIVYTMQQNPLILTRLTDSMEL